ncbi:MAG: arginine repressor [Eubacteriales bacterium]|nr:arginine repressor [Eubacteriales bacterium]
MKYDRQAGILELIENHEIETQDELVARLAAKGFEVTQATVSRDIKELKIIKVMTGDGKSRYSIMNQGGADVSDKLLTIFSKAYISADYANNIVVIKTLPGMAQAAASAIDSLKWGDIIGTIAGDDTIMILCRAEVIAERMTEKFTRIGNSK